MSNVKTYESLYECTEALVEIADSVDPDQRDEWLPKASEFVTLCQGVDVNDRSSLSNVQALLDYADGTDHRDWDLEELRQFAQNISGELECSEKRYTYRSSNEGPEGDSWEVYGVYLDGSEDWVGYVTTETVALNLIAVLNNPSLVQEVSNAA